MKIDLCLHDVCVYFSNVGLMSYHFFFILVSLHLDMLVYLGKVFLLVHYLCIFVLPCNTELLANAILQKL